MDNKIETENSCLTNQTNKTLIKEEKENSSRKIMEIRRATDTHGEVI